jgi:hypothetical protein
MKLSEIKNQLKNLTTIAFQLPNGDLVPNHFHVTEVGKITKHFIDCGGVVRSEEVANFQLWEANDYDHRLHPEKLVHIIELSEAKLQIPDLEMEVNPMKWMFFPCSFAYEKAATTSLFCIMLLSAHARLIFTKS